MRKMKYGLIQFFNEETKSMDYMKVPKRSRRYKEYLKSFMKARYYVFYGEFPPSGFPIRKWNKEYVKCGYPYF